MLLRRSKSNDYKTLAPRLGGKNERKKTMGTANRFGAVKVEYLKVQHSGFFGFVIVTDTDTFTAPEKIIQFSSVTVLFSVYLSVCLFCAGAFRILLSLQLYSARRRR